MCFAVGTFISVPGGARRVEDLRPGDPVLTMDNGVQYLQMSLRRTLNFARGDDPCHKPIEFKPDALGPGCPTHRLVVSPQHRMLMHAEGGQEVLVPAKALTHRRGIRAMKGCREVTYIHLVFARHEIVSAHGCWSESFYPGAYATATFGHRTRLELMDIFPELKSSEVVRPARSMLRFGEAHRMFDRNVAFSAMPNVAAHSVTLH